MGSRWLRDLPDVISDAGLDLALWAGWENRARSSGGYDDVLAVFCHHTASNTSPDSDRSYMWDSTSGDQPIGALYLARDGRVTVGAAGATNCQGKGGPWALSRGTIPLDRGNSYGIAIEAANAGTGEAWPTAQTDAYVRLVDALCVGYGLDPARDVLAHFEWCEPSCPGRKIDPFGPSPWAGSSSWNMPAFRADVAACSSSSPTPEPEPDREEDYMPGLLITAVGGNTPGAVAVTDLNLTTKRWLQADDVNALLGTGHYAFVELVGSTFDSIPGEAPVDVVEGGR